MHGEDRRTESLFSFVDHEAKLPMDHPLHLIRKFVNDLLGAMPKPRMSCASIMATKPMLKKKSGGFLNSLLRFYSFHVQGVRFVFLPIFFNFKTK